MKWSDEERRKVIAMFKRGKGKKHIAEVLGRTTASIVMMLHREGVVRNRQWTLRQIETARLLYEQGKTDREVGRILGRTKGAIRMQRHSMKEAENDRKVVTGRNQSVEADDSIGQDKQADCLGYAPET